MLPLIPESTTEVINLTPLSPSSIEGTSFKLSSISTPSFNASICFAKSEYKFAKPSRYPSGCPGGILVTLVPVSVVSFPARLIIFFAFPKISTLK